MKYTVGIWRGNDEPISCRFVKAGDEGFVLAVSIAVSVASAESVTWPGPKIQEVKRWEVELLRVFVGVDIIIITSMSSVAICSFGNFRRRSPYGARTASPSISGKAGTGVVSVM